MRISLVSGIAVALALGFLSPLVAQQRASSQPFTLPEYGIVFTYSGMVPPKEYLSSHPCISGQWIYKRQTDDYWIGDVHYPTENTSDQILYVAFELKVKKSNSIPVDLEKWQGIVFLQKQTPDSQLDSRDGDAHPMTFIGYQQKVEGKSLKSASFFFSKNEQYKYQKQDD